ncbi:hypothetical protein [Glycomyces terrestris]|uniref:Nucleoside 2-deoxyribosyltransferase n=1 Tax=Glycomyces terrestris TaxID=2493553 RepID=A0A426USQ6_9ACTN|nr:hypothetical protein [Glycomyces terrestris]RRR96523.1 hypothetical protein EIW28_22085 [Glycomyces terrestris]
MKPGTNDAPWTVAIIGSFRQYYEQTVSAALKFESALISVLTPPISRITNPGADFVRFETDAFNSSDHQIQAVTLTRILSADFVYVVAPGGYIGRTTSYELGRVHAEGIPVYYSERPEDLPIPVSDEQVATVDELTRLLGNRRLSGTLLGPELS